MKKIMPYHFSIWFKAIRPRTLPASIGPVLLATAMAWGDGVSHWPSALACLFTAVFIQIATNLSNDYFDGMNGVDTHERKGPVRVTQSGLIPPRLVRWAFILSFFASGLAAIPLVVRAGWPAVIIGILSLLAGYFYTAGPRPFSYLGLGELFVLIFFGPVAVMGTYYVQSFETNPAVFLAGLGCGFFSTAILAVNNLRDIDTDRRSGKFSLAVRWGEAFARMEYLFCLLAACAMPPVICLMTGQSSWAAMSSAVIFLCIPLIHTVCSTTEAAALNKALSLTGIMLIIFCLAFSLGWVL
jgi:1,4-dihydroxy-2-naphthoate octaprenyltransferase